MVNKQLTDNWRLRSRERVWGRPWVVVEVEEHVTGQPIPHVPYYVDKLEWRPMRLSEAGLVFAVASHDEFDAFKETL